MKIPERTVTLLTIALVVAFYFGSAHFVREESLSGSLKECIYYYEERTSCQCLVDVHREVEPLYSFWLNMIFEDDAAKEEKGKRYVEKAVEVCSG